jgi:formylglycine-generating enzyme required for sulfatase activity
MVRRSSALFLAPMAAGSSLVFGISGDAYVHRDADAGPGGPDAAVAPTPDASDGSSAPPPDSGPPTCPGPGWVRVGDAPAAFCIDADEVTNAQYKQFLAAKGTDTSGQHPRCGFNDSFIPGGSWPLSSAYDNFPVASVDWCDAWAYCAWAGKRLCGRIGGGPVDSNNTDPRTSQWMAACTGEGARVFPYGNEYDRTKCNTDTARIEPIRSVPTCVGGVDGLYDMSGGVEEWEDSCYSVDAGDPTGATDTCVRRGGSFNDSNFVANYQCTSSLGRPRSVHDNDAGFRCCSLP